MRILLVDDEVNLLRTMAAILRRAGHTVQTASSARDAVQALHGSPFDLMFLDVRMPDINGLDLLPQVVEIDPDLRVIMLTAYPNQETQCTAMARGASGFLIKPLDPSRLLEYARSSSKKWSSEIPLV